jgi:hypothetical protein
MKTLATAVAMVAIVVALAMSFGGLAVTPSPTGGYGVAIESDYAQVQALAQRHETERARIAAEAAVEQAAIAATVATEQQTTVRIVVPLVALLLAGTVIAVVRSKRVTAPPAQLVMYVASHYLPGQASVDQVNGEWCVIDHERREVWPARLLEVES